MSRVLVRYLCQITMYTNFAKVYTRSQGVQIWKTNIFIVIWVSHKYQTIAGSQCECCAHIVTAAEWNSLVFP